MLLQHNILSLSEIYLTYGPSDEEFITYLISQNVNSTARQSEYLIALKKRFLSIRTPNELTEYARYNNGKNMTQKYRGALNKYLSYSLKHNLTSVNGFDIKTAWIPAIRKAKIGNKTAEEMGRNGVVYLTDEEVVAGMENLPGELRTFYLMLAYSGARCAQLYDAIRYTKPENRKIERITPPFGNTDILRFDIREYSRGRAYVDYLYFPVELGNALRNYTIFQSAFYFKKNIQNLQDKNRIVNVTSLRDWNYRTMFRIGVGKLNFPEREDPWDTMLRYRSALNLVQGRIAVSDNPELFDKNERAERAAGIYATCVKELTEILGVPDFVRRGEVIYRPKQTEEEKNAVEIRVKRMLEETFPNGKYRYSHMEIRKTTGISTSPLNRIIEKYGLERK